MITENLKKLNIVLSEPPDPVGAYVAFKKIKTFFIYLGSYLLRKMVKC